MAPLKPINKIHQENMVATANGMKTRSHIIPMKKDSLPKRKAEESPIKRATTKRTALADIKNHEGQVEGKNAAGKKSTTAVPSKMPVRASTATSRTTAVKKEAPKASLAIQQVKVTESKLPKPRQVEKITITRKTEIHKCVATTTSGVVTRSSIKNSELEKSESSLYVSALEDLNLDDKKVIPRKEVRRAKPPLGVHDYDKEQMEDLASVAMYAADIFAYLKTREHKFPIDDYMARQTSINKTMRALLVDWMVEIQENFELNHETLYLAVKMVDLFLCKKNIKKETLQLVGCACLFVSSKYDERIPPLIEDFLYVCDNLYDANDIMEMEKEILETLEFQLGIPISYRFLRRYARTAKIDMPLLTLARFILEYSLMDYSMVSYSDSKIAAAALYLAILMKDPVKGSWTANLQYYSTYKVKDFKDIVFALNTCLHKKLRDNIKTVRTKYSHKVFFEVANTPLIDNVTLANILCGANKNPSS